MALKEYQVRGKFDEKKIDIKLMAYSKKQAKLKAAFDYGYSGNKLSSFMKSSKIKVKQIK